MRKIFSYAFIGIISLGYLNFSASVIERATSETNVEKVGQNTWVYSSAPQAYTGSNTAYGNGAKEGYGKLELLEIINNHPNKTSCVKTGNMGIDGKADLSCTATISSSNNKAQTRVEYTNLTGTTSLRASLYN